MIVFRKAFNLQFNFLIGLLFLLVGCEKDVSDEVKIPVKPKLAIFSFLSPQDTVLAVKVYKTQPILGFSQVFDTVGIRDATVQLSDGSKSVTLTYKRVNINMSAYYGIDAAAFPIVAGKTYSLTVSTPDGLRATGTCTIPGTEGITISDLAHSEVEKKDEYNPGRTYVDHSFDFKFKDAPGSNYYRTDAYFKFKNNQDGGRQWISSMGYDTRKAFISDDRRDGMVLDAPTASFTMVEDGSISGPYTLVALVAVTDKAYYLYHQSLDRQSGAEDNPFAEPAIVYSNIQDGLGVFCGYNQLLESIIVE